jgi:hypothetical protein
VDSSSCRTSSLAHATCTWQPRIRNDSKNRVRCCGSPRLVPGDATNDTSGCETDHVPSTRADRSPDRPGRGEVNQRPVQSLRPRGGFGGFGGFLGSSPPPSLAEPDFAKADPACRVRMAGARYADFLTNSRRELELGLDGLSFMTNSAEESARQIAASPQSLLARNLHW